jgi:hypothetical protein
VLKDVQGAEGQIILFIDELHTLSAPEPPKARWTRKHAQTHVGPW